MRATRTKGVAMIAELLCRCWTDGGEPPENSKVDVALKRAGKEFLGRATIPATPKSIEDYCNEHIDFDFYYSPVVALENGTLITSSLVIDIDNSGQTDFKGYKPFAVVQTGRGVHAYIALDRIYCLDELYSAEAVNKYFGGDANVGGRYLRRYFRGFNYKFSPPYPIKVKTYRVVKYRYSELAERAGAFHLSNTPPKRSNKTDKIITFADAGEVWNKFNKLVEKDFRLKRILTQSYKSTSEKSYAVALALSWRGFETAETARILLNLSGGIKDAPRQYGAGELEKRACTIAESAERAFIDKGLDRNKRLVLYHSTHFQERGISAMKLFKLSGLSKAEFDKALMSLKDAGLAEIRTEKKSGRNARKIVKIFKTSQKELLL